ncbi:Phosphotyrosyl phosphatase activator [Abortiporus biennis]|nr:Phosphotyrosyl phosphatase activator [Abortiporus biennis]
MAHQEELLPLRHIPISEVAQMNSLPTTKIKTDEDVELWKTTRSYEDYGIFLRRLNESVVGHFLPWTSPSLCKATAAILSMLDTLDSWIDDIPPLNTPQRFGNLAFRTWGKKLEHEATNLLTILLPSELHVAIPHLTPYLLTSFGSFTRMDYGTGHETSFALLLLCLSLIRFFEPEPNQERDLVLSVFLRYLQLCWRLQDVYKLEPAGSHGVWGLDDYCFLGYIFGSAQLRETDIPVTAILHQPLPPTNLYFLCISRIHQVKYGPFHEHSSQLHSIAIGVPRWAKVNTGLFKMYEAEVLGKRVVVQHIPLGGILEWNVPSSPQRDEIAARHADVPMTSAPWSSPCPISSVTEAHTSTSYHSLRAVQGLPSSDNMAPYPTRHSTAHPSTVTGRTHHGSHRSGPILPAQAPLGPTANPKLQPRMKPAVHLDPSGSRTSMGPPPNP